MMLLFHHQAKREKTQEMFRISVHAIQSTPEIETVKTLEYLNPGMLTRVLCKNTNHACRIEVVYNSNSGKIRVHFYKQNILTIIFCK